MPMFGEYCFNLLRDTEITSLPKYLLFLFLLTLFMQDKVQICPSPFLAIHQNAIDSPNLFLICECCCATRTEIIIAGLTRYLRGRGERMYTFAFFWASAFCPHFKNNTHFFYVSLFLSLLFASWKTRCLCSKFFLHSCRVLGFSLPCHFK